VENRTKRSPARGTAGESSETRFGLLPDFALVSRWLHSGSAVRPAVGAGSRARYMEDATAVATSGT